MKKYELVSDDTLEVFGVTLFRLDEWVEKTKRVAAALEIAE